MAATAVQKKACTACESKKTTARCPGCKKPLCKMCKKECSLCDSCAEYYSKQVSPSERDVRRRLGDPAWTEQLLLVNVE